MKTAIKLSSIILLLILHFTTIAECIEKDRREVWPIVENAVTRIGDEQFKVYQDPKNPSHVFIYQGCWLLRRDTKSVVVPNCTFELVGEVLYFDKTWRSPEGYVPGVEWGDPKMDNISFFSSIFRKPKFKDNSVSIWDGDRWIHIEGLHTLIKDRNKER